MELSQLLLLDATVVNEKSAKILLFARFPSRANVLKFT